MIQSARSAVENARWFLNWGCRSRVTGEPHVSDIELLAFAAGTGDEKKQFEIADHVRGCARCRAFVRAMEHVGGTILESLAPTSLAAGSFAAVMGTTRPRRVQRY